MAKFEAKCIIIRLPDIDKYYVEIVTNILIQIMKVRNLNCKNI